MLKMFKIFVFLLGISLVGCTGTRFTPEVSEVQKLQYVDVKVTRADFSGIFLEIFNNSDKEIVIDWKKSMLNDAEVTQDKVLEFHDEVSKTKVPAHQSYKTVLYRRKDIYYLDPVLYVPGGFRVKRLQYPVNLKLVIDGIVNEKNINFLELLDNK